MKRELKSYLAGWLALYLAAVCLPFLLAGCASDSAAPWPVDGETTSVTLRMSVVGGTCRQAQFGDIEVCGKTGTAQNPHGRDHSAFMGFAPMNNPKIAICVYVENAGFGATFGVPIGGLMMEKYLTGQISPHRQYIEDRMLESNTIIYSGVKKH